MFNILIIIVYIIMSFNWNEINSENFHNINEYNPIKLNNINNISIENNSKINLSNVTTNKDNMNKFMNNNIIYNNNNNNNNGNNKGSERILSRKRRYLIFPEGSSFQVVWDGIVPIVDYNNYLILGITVALAWELPSKPPSEQLEDIREKLNNGTLGLQRNDTINNIKYIDTNNKNSPSTLMMMTNSKLNNDGNYYSNSMEENILNTNKFHPPLTYYNNNNNGENYYYNNHNNNNNNNNKYISKFNSIGNNQRRPMYYNNKLNYYNESNWRKSNQYQHYNYNNNNNNNYYKKKNNYLNWNQLNNNPWTKFTNRIKNAWRRNGQSTNKKSSTKKTYHKNKYPQRRKHRIYPVFGKRKKRSTESINFSPIEKRDLRHHRSSRHGLYEKIEKFLKAKNQNGFECVLRALCETGQKEDEEEPTTFLGEIMRAIFTMPQSIDPVNHHKHKAYDEAHAHDGDCNEKYPLCDGSIWTPDFII